MISIISINSGANATINTKPVNGKAVRIAEESSASAANGQNEANEVDNKGNEYNKRNVIKVQTNYCPTHNPNNKSQSHSPGLSRAIAVIDHNEHNNNNNNSKATHPSVGHENVLAQSISHDEFDVDEGFNEDSSSSIISGNVSIVSNGSGGLRGRSPSTPTAPSPDFDEIRQKLNHVTINGPNGSVRGKRNTVRSRIQNYKELIKLANTEKADLERNYEKEEQNLCVLYITSMGIIRQTYENCRKLKAILTQHLIRFDERDIYINPNFKTELIERTNGSFEVPALFVNGKPIGNLEVLERLNECGQLSGLLSEFKLRSVSGQVCECCGGSKFIPCQACNGSTKSQIHHFVSDSISLKCSQCRRSGLQKCPKCYSNVSNNSDTNDRHEDY